MTAKALHDRLERLEQSAGASAPVQFDEAAWERFRARLDELHGQRDALRKAREALPLEKRLALARQDHAAALERPDCPEYAVWGYGLKARSLEVEILERDGLATAEQVAELRAQCKRMLGPFAPLPVVVDVESVPGDEMRRVEREIDDWLALHRELRDAASRQLTPPDRYRRLHGR